MHGHKTIAETTARTVICKHTPTKSGATQYQSEDQLEAEFIRLLQVNGYEHLPIKNNDDLMENLRVQLCRLNDIKFSDPEWRQIVDNYLVNKNESIEEKTTKVQEDYIYNLIRDNGSTKNVRIIDKKNIHNNTVQVINQYEAKGARKNRYDVTILINGLPLVHVELKRRGVVIKEAFNQINRYQRDSFWADSGLFEYVQLFVISNGTHTKYYSNTTRNAGIKERQGRKPSRKKTSNSFEFTCWWADAKNNQITDLVDFTKTFFSKHTLLAVLTKYCVFTSDKLLLVMRPYQIVATERILNKIAMATNHKLLGTPEAGGFIWHATGSGKTLTSFKAAQLATGLEDVDKVVFVVDRKDLDYQTIKEYDKFQKGAADSNTSTRILTKQLGNPNAKIIITTIQKLARFISTNRAHEVFKQHVVLIFDECHRSQFGEMHTQITKAFKKYNIFGFTGTPIFAENAASGGKAHLKTTQQAFGDRLHAYTIVDAISDENVLKFKVDFINTMKMKDGIEDKKVRAIDVEAAARAPERITKVTDYILNNFNKKTKRDDFYSFNKLSNIEEVAKDKSREVDKKIPERREQVSLRGFNSIFAVSSIDIAKRYYAEFKARGTDLKVATIFSFAPNEEEPEDGILADEDFDTSGLDKLSRDFLGDAIKDYNNHFGTSYDTSSDKFENYYKDLSQRVKNREVDLLIVVNMFLTGFDATTLNTLWVDKNLRHHGLIQAFSRTNRILNTVKTSGNIICFRDLGKATDEALSIFGNENAHGIVLLRPFEDYYKGWEQDGEHHKGYFDYITELEKYFTLPITFKGEQDEKDFIKLWGAILRLRNILSSFDEFDGEEILSKRNFQDYQGVYLDLYDKHRKHNDADKENINDDIEFEIELVRQIIINIDYILELVAEYQKSKVKDKELLINIYKVIDSNIELRSKKELIERFINQLNADTDVYKEWPEFAEKSRTDELEAIIAEENLKPEPTRKFIKNAFRDGELKTTGTGFVEILPPMPMFEEDDSRSKKKFHVFEKLRLFFEKYFGIV